MVLETIFFDVGSTLVFAEPNLVRGPLLDRGITPSDTQLRAAEREARVAIDDILLERTAPVDGTYWKAYYSKLSRDLAISDEGLISALIERARVSSNWCLLKPDTNEVLEELSSRYPLAIISNADGKIVDLLKKVGIRRFFKTITDSGSIGVEKPDPRIFRAALESLNAKPETSLYVGDIYSVDYMGAAGVGMQSILMDSYGVYRDSGLPRVESLTQLRNHIHAATA